MTSAVQAFGFGEYVVERQLGAGAMGEVYLARDPILDRLVAIKRIAARTVSDAARERFVVEARAAARIQHDNVAAVYRAGEVDGSPFIVSEFVAGAPLDTLAFPLAYERVLDIAVGLARGLAAAHERGVLHRDLKPGNVILADGDRPKLVDFGLAKLLEAHGPSPPSPASAPSARDATIAPEAQADRRDATIAPGSLASPRDATVAPTSRDATVAPPYDATIAPALPRALTRDGALLGTPDYMAPELWRGEIATAATDLYALGALLFEITTGAVPFASTPVEALRDTVLSTDPPSLAEHTVGMDRRFVAIVDRCLARSADDRFASAEEVAAALERLRRASRVGSVPEGNPYRGLAAFDARHRALFFGRDRDVERIVDRLKSSPLVVVTGDSGLGKSSLVRAGVVPRLTESDDGRAWASARITPGRHPLTAIVDALDAILGIGSEQLRALIETRPSDLASTLRRRLGSQRGFLLVVDQLEEFCTQSVEDERDLVAELIARLADDVAGVRILATLRADYLTRLAALPRLGEQLCRSIHVVGPLDDGGIRDVIVGPARATGTRFESEALVDTLVDATKRSRRGALPLLQFALERLWERRDEATSTITRATLDAMGGVAGALARHADEVVAGLPAHRRRHARAVLVMLTSEEGVRVTRTANELAPDRDPDRITTLDALVEGRLVIASDAAEATVYELAHEILIDGWPTLAQWREEDEDVRAAQERLDAAVREWARLDCSEDALWSAPQLQEIAPLVARMELGGETRRFVDESNHRVQRARRRRIARFVGPPIFVALAVASVLTVARIRIDRQADVALGLGLAAARKAESAHATETEVRREAFAAFDRGDARAEDSWSRARELAERAERHYRDALQHVERALALRPDRDDLADHFARLLFERATLAETHDHTELAAELVERAALYDADGAWVSRWHAPARVELVGLAPSATTTLERFVGTESSWRTIPLTEQLAPGSYRLSVESTGGVVRHPFVVRRGEHLALDVSVPHPSLPDGFVFVPAGRFFYGSTADDESRIGFFDAVPAHEVELPAFAIARYEVTFERWLEFLDHLAPSERDRFVAAHMNDSGLTSGGTSLRRDANGWTVTMRPAQVEYVAHESETIRYPDRDRRRTQDWLRMPVTGVSADDARAYLAWLRDSGRTPGARLCTELEWERAARGADRREYPHADVLEADAANFDQTYKKAPGGMGPDEVGAHPASDSPFGLSDMSGNAFEWTTAATSTATYVLRGGSFFYDAKTNRLPNRAVAVSTLRVGSVGFRVCLDTKGTRS